MEKEKIVKQEKDQKQNQEKDRQVKIMTKKILRWKGRLTC